MGVADHVEQRLGLMCAVDHPVGIEDLVTAVLGVCLRKHHQFHIGGIASDTTEGLDKVIDFVARKRES